MSSPYLGQIRAFAFNFPPNGWAFCNGQTLAINQYEALFALLGTTYGGNGVTTFQLPNLQGCVPMMTDNIHYILGGVGGEVNHTLTAAEIPQHSHALVAATSIGSQTAAAGNLLAAQASNPYSNAGANATLGAGTATAGNSLPHNNLQPYLVVNYCIALVGIFPSRS